MYTAQERKGLDTLFEDLLQAIRQGTREEALIAAQAAWELCRSFLDLGELPHQQHLTVSKTIKAELRYMAIAAVARQLLVQGTADRRHVVAEVRRQWERLGRSKPIPSLGTVRTALRNHKI